MRTNKEVELQEFVNCTIPVLRAAVDLESWLPAYVEMKTNNPQNPAMEDTMARAMEARTALRLAVHNLDENTVNKVKGELHTTSFLLMHQLQEALEVIRFYAKTDPLSKMELLLDTGEFVSLGQKARDYLEKWGEG